jgi:hypothetical protein
MRIDPGSLAPLVLDQKVRLMTHDGTYAEGRVVKASEASLTLQVRKTEPKGKLSPPEAVLPLSSISVIRLRKEGGLAAPISLGIAGGISGIFLGFVAACCESSTSSLILIPIGTGIGGAIGGSLLGREINRKTVTIYLNRPKPQTE